MRIESAPRHPHEPRPPEGVASVGADYLQGAALVLDTATSDVRALIGGPDFGDSRFNRATQARRQPGSAFKPVLRAAAMAVPLWTEVMKLASRGDRPVWQPRPAGVVAHLICRMSGKLATDGCQYVEVVNEAGDVEVTSMASTEFFRRGRVPTAYCALHPLEARRPGLPSGLDVPGATGGRPPE